ncbi:MAG: hypothetical protein QM765_39115 [Myxococcales bacterium]
MGSVLRAALGDRDLNRGSGRELRQRLLEDGAAREALDVVAEELGLRFAWSGEARLDVLPLPDCAFAYTKADLKAEGFKDPHLFVAIALGVAAFFFPDGDFGGDPFRQEGSLADLDDYLCDRMKQALTRTDLPQLEERLRAEVKGFITAWTDKAQAAPGQGQRKSRFAELRRAIQFLEARRYVRVVGEREESMRIYPAERLRMLAQHLGDAPHYEVLVKLLRDPSAELSLPELPERTEPPTEE